MIQKYKIQQLELKRLMYMDHTNRLKGFFYIKICMNILFKINREFQKWLAVIVIGI